MTSCVLERVNKPGLTSCRLRATCPPRVYSVKSQCVVSILRQVTRAGRSQYTETTLSTIVRPKSRTVLPTSNKSMWLIYFSYSLSFSVQFELRIHPNLRERVTFRTLTICISGLLITVCLCSAKRIVMADLEGRPRNVPPPTAQNFLNFMQFLGKLGKIVCWTLP